MEYLHRNSTLLVIRNIYIQLFKTGTLIALFAVFAVSMQAQVLTQTIRGNVIDKTTNQALVGVTVSVVNHDDIGTTTDLDGDFTLENVPMGRQQFQFSYIGFQTFVTEGIIVSSSRSAELIIGLSEGVLLDNIQIVADGNVNAPVNELATVSARSFSVEEPKRNGPKSKSSFSIRLYPPRSARTKVIA